MNDKPQQNSVKNLQSMYSTVVGIALALALSSIVDVVHPQPLLHWGALWVLAAYLVTIIPFYHGALRHFDARYIEDTAADHSRWALPVDFFMLFIESCILFICAALINTPSLYVWAFVALLLFDVCWVVISCLVSACRTEYTFQIRWCLLNIVTAVILIVYVVAEGYLVNANRPAIFGRWVILVVAVVRTIIDYGLSWEFYYPSQE